MCTLNQKVCDMKEHDFGIEEEKWTIGSTGEFIGGGSSNIGDDQGLDYLGSEFTGP